MLLNGFFPSLLVFIYLHFSECALMYHFHIWKDVHQTWYRHVEDVTDIRKQQIVGNNKFILIDIVTSDFFSSNSNPYCVQKSSLLIFIFKCRYESIMQIL